MTDKYTCLCRSCTEDYEWENHRTQSQLKKYYENIRRMDDEEDMRSLHLLWTGY